MKPGEIYHLEDAKPLHGGKPKGRYVVIVTREDEIVLDNPIFVVACSSSARRGDFDLANLVALPWSKQGPVRTGFRKPTDAIPSWLLRVRPSQLGRKAGTIPKNKLQIIVELLPDDPIADTS
ncbi:MAG: hypothetical protein IID30_11560 [Planctomycetes bacterium]|nr:hypothetical protein [Planctomycetota bacterium]